MLPKEPYKRFIMIVLYIAIGIGGVYIFFKYLWGAVLPFVFAYAFAELFKPLVRYSEKHKSFPKKFAVLFLILLVTVSIAMAFYGIARQIFAEILDFSQWTEEILIKFQNDDSYASQMIEKINQAIPLFDISDKLWDMRENLNEELWAMAINLADKAGGSLFSLIGRLVAFLPNAVFALVVVVISTYYFAIDRVKINCFFISLFPKSTQPYLKRIKDILANTVGKYLRAYGLLFLITFIELSAAFMFLGLEYSLLLALIISVVDVLPVLGTGTVLVPWALFALTLGDIRVGIGLLITYAVVTVVRQVIEPKIVGKFIGIPPLATLASMYVGLKLLGIMGLFLFPLAAILLKNILETREE